MSHINESNPTPHTKYPPVFPVLLAGVQKLFPFSFIAPKVLVLLFGAAGILILSRLVLDRVPLAVGVPALLLSAVNPEMVHFSSLILSELPYFFLSMLAIWFAFKFEKDESRTGLLVAAVLLSVAAYYTRTIGIALVMAMVAWRFFRRDFKRAALIFAAFILLAAPWGIRNRSVGGTDYLTQFLSVNPYEPDKGRLRPIELITVRVKENLKKYATLEVGRGILARYQTRPPENGRLAWITLSILVTVIAGMGVAYRAIREKGGVLEIYLLFYLGICLLWPEVWASLRFLVPVVPLLFLFLLRALADLGEALRFRGARWIPALATLLLLIPAVQSTTPFITGRAVRPANWRNYFAAADWIRENTPESSVVLCRKPYLFYLYSRRKSDSYLWSYDSKKVYEQMAGDGVTHVVVSQLSGTEMKYLIPMINDYYGEFEQLVQIENPSTYVMRWHPPGDNARETGR